MSEPLVHINSKATLSPEEIAGRSFTVSRRGFDADAVRKFLEEIAVLVRESKSRENSLRVLLEEAQRQAEAPPEFDEATLSAAVGVETGRVLQVAHEAARDLLENAEIKAKDILEKAETKASSVVAGAESSTAERIRVANQEASTLLTRARAEADTAVASAKRTCMEMLEEAREARRRILADLAERRRSLHSQLEQIRAGKDSLAEVVESVAHSVDAIRGRLIGAEEEARDAADVAARYPGTLDDGVTLDELVANALVNFVPSGEVIEEKESVDDGTEATTSTSDTSTSEPTELFDGRAEEIVIASTDADVPTVDGEASEVPQDSVIAVVVEETVAIDDVATAPDATDELAVEEPVEASSAESDEAVNPVDELFAKIRASRAEEVDKAHAVLDAATVEAAIEIMESSDVDVPSADAGELVATDVADESVADETTVVTSTEAQPEAEVTHVYGEESLGEVTVAVDPSFLRRDELVSPEFQKISKSLKRALASEQNEMLDAIRNLGKSTDTSSLFNEEECRERLSLACASGLAQAFRAGGEFAQETVGDSVTNGVDAAVSEKEASIAGDEVAQLLVADIVSTLSRRIRGGFPESGTDQAALSSIVGSAFRDWKGSRVEAVADDFAMNAFSLGTRSFASTHGLKVAWVLDESGAECGDCDDNALSGEQMAGEAFPTGQSNPPAHPGCRCLLVPLGS